VERYVGSGGNYFEPIKVKVKHSHCRPGQEVEAPRFQDNRHMKVVKLSVLRTGRLYTHEIFLVLISVRSCQPRCHSAAGRNLSMKNSNYTIGNRTCDLPTCRAVPQPTALPRAPFETIGNNKIITKANMETRLKITDFFIMQFSPQPFA